MVEGALTIYRRRHSAIGQQKCTRIQSCIIYAGKPLSLLGRTLRRDGQQSQKGTGTHLIQSADQATESRDGESRSSCLITVTENLTHRPIAYLPPFSLLDQNLWNALLRISPAARSLTRCLLL